MLKAVEKHRFCKEMSRLSCPNIDLDIAVISSLAALADHNS